MENLLFSVRDSVKTGWKLAKNNLVVLCGLILAYTTIYYAVYFTFLPSNKPDFGFWVTMLFLLLFSVVFSLGFYKLCLDIVDGKDAEFSAFKEGLKKLKTYLVLVFIYLGFIIVVSVLFTFVFLLIVLVSGAHNYAAAMNPESISKSMVILIPLAIFWIAILLFLIRFMYAPIIIVDTDKGAVEALKRSWEITRGKFGKLVALGIVFLLINIVGFIALIVGIFVTMAVTSVGFAVSYRMLAYEYDLKNKEEKIEGKTDTVLPAE